MDSTKLMKLKDLHLTASIYGRAIKGFLAVAGCQRSIRKLFSDRLANVGIFFDERQKRHAGDIGPGGDIKCRGKTVMLHDVADDQRPDRPGDKADEIVNRKCRVGELRGGEVGDHGLRQRAPCLDKGAVKNQVEIEQNRQRLVLDKPNRHDALITAGLFG